MLTSDSEAEYGTWTDPETSFRVKYPLPLFYEIDFLVNETYRRIPRGGIEIGALLFGQAEPGGIRIEAFRSIHCEHALGPSFKLSESDAAAFRLQVQTAQADQETGGPHLLGWFIAHTRNPLELNAAEAALLDELLPGAGKLTLLIKPEKFKPTLFAFLIRREDGQMPLALEERTMILPLTTPAAQNGEEPSVAATEIPPTTVAPTPVIPHAPAPAIAHTKPGESNAPAVTTSDEQMAALRKAVLSAKQMASAETANPAPSNRAPVDRVPPLADRVPPSAERVPPPIEREAPPPPRPQRPVADTLRETATHQFGNLPVPVEPAWPIDAYPAPTFDAGMGERTVDRRAARMSDEYNAQSKLQFAAVMIVAAALGCALGYLAYLQLPSPVIPLNVQPEASGLTVYWPPEQTRSSVYAAIRINDGEPVALASEAKTAGHSRITAEGDIIKVELIAQHWMRDSRGIVRFVTAVKQPAPPAVTAKPRRRAAAKPPLEIPRPEEAIGTQQP